MNAMKYSALLFVVLAVLSAAARQSVSTRLPPVTYADTETTTNVPFAAMLDVAGRFSFSLSCLATPSNNVEVAFGSDANGNGVLDLDEIERVVGWDCGAWFTRRRADGVPVNAVVESTNDIRTITWELKTGMGGTPVRLSVMADDVSVFAGLPLESVYSPSWNLLRLTGRGLDASHESFTVVVRPDSTAIIMR